MEMMTGCPAEAMPGCAGPGRVGIHREYLCPDRDQMFLLPASMRDWLEPGHLAWFVIDTVRSASFDTGALHVVSGVVLGRRPYEPEMMCELLLYAQQPALLTAGFAGRALSRSAGSAPPSARASSAPTLGSSQASRASGSARMTGIRSWIAEAMRFGAESHVNSATLCIHSPLDLGRGPQGGERERRRRRPGTGTAGGARPVLRLEPLVVAVGDLQRPRDARGTGSVGGLVVTVSMRALIMRLPTSGPRPTGDQAPAHQLGPGAPLGETMAAPVRWGRCCSGGSLRPRRQTRRAGRRSCGG